METYRLEIVGLIRDLPIVRVSDKLKIASFVILGDAQLSLLAAKALAEKIPKVDVLITAEAKGIPLVQELAHILGMDRYIVARKNVKPYMIEPMITEVFSITTQRNQILCLDRSEVEFMENKRALIIDDVISTGESLKAMERLVKKAGAKLVGKAAILVEGDAIKRKDIIHLGHLPVFPASNEV